MNFKILNPRYWFQKRESVLGSEHVRLEQMAKFNALYGCDPDKIVAAVTQFNAGSIAPLARIIEAFEQNDDKMKICSMKMKASAARCDYSIRLKEGYEDDARAKAHMDTLKRFWSTIRVTNRFKMNETGGIRLLKKHMMDAQSFGYAVHEIIWKPLQNGELSAEFVKLPLWHFENHTGSLRFLKREYDYEGEIMREGEWLVTSGDGVGIAASICAMAKHLSFQDWLLFSERSGMPIIHGATTAAFGSDQWNNLKAALRSIGRDCRIQTDAETKIELVGSASATNIPYPALVDWADRAIAGLYRGADLSTISKGDGTGASLQGDESAMLEQDACALMGETLHEQIDRFVIRYVYGEEALAYISIDPVDKPDVDTDIKVDNHLAELGVKLSKKEALQRYGRAEAENEADALKLQKETPFKPDGIGFANEKKDTFTDKTTRKDPGPSGSGEKGDHDAILKAFAEDSSAAAGEIRDLLKNPSPEKAAALLQKLPELLPEDPAMAAVIAEAMAAEFGKTGSGEGLANVERVPAGHGNAGQFTGKTNQPRGKEPETKSQHDRWGLNDPERLAVEPQKNAERAKNALDEVVRKKSGYADKAAYRQECGWIRFDWGDPGNPHKDWDGGHGIAHIQAKHPRDLKHLPDVIAKGEAFRHPTDETKTYFVFKDRFAVVASLHKGAKKTITEFEPERAKDIATIKNYPRALAPGKKGG